MDENTKRRHKRLEREAKVTVSKLAFPLDANPRIDVSMINLSEGGVAIRCPEPFVEGDSLQLEISLPGWYRHTSALTRFDEEMVDKPLTAVGKVTRCVEDEGGFSVGVLFTDIWQDHWSAMRRLLERQLNQAD